MHRASDADLIENTWDVAVVGSGPAGSSAARAAASSGARVVLIDAAILPRYKTCGGGLIGVSTSLIPDLETLPIMDSITTLSMTLRGQHLRQRSSSTPFMAMINRHDLDLHLARAAVAAGAYTSLDTKVTEIVTVDGGVHLSTSRGLVRARVVVGADGSSSRVGRIVGVEYLETDLGLEAEIEAGTERERWRGRVHLDFGPIKGSYGWLFPKGEVLTVGVIAGKGNPQETKTYLEDLISMLGLGALLATSATLFTILKWVGAAYLVYLGIKLWRAGGTLDALRKRRAFAGWEKDGTLEATPVWS